MWWLGAWGQVLAELMAADRLHDAGYASAAEFRAVLDRVFAAKMRFFQALRERLDVCKAVAVVRAVARSA